MTPLIFFSFRLKNKTQYTSLSDQSFKIDKSFNEIGKYPLQHTDIYGRYSS